MLLGQAICSCDHVTPPSQCVMLTRDCPSPFLWLALWFLLKPFDHSLLQDYTKHLFHHSATCPNDKKWALCKPGDLCKNLDNVLHPFFHGPKNYFITLFDMAQACLLKVYKEWRHKTPTSPLTVFMHVHAVIELVPALYQNLRPGVGPPPFFTIGKDSNHNAEGAIIPQGKKGVSHEADDDTEGMAHVEAGSINNELAVTSNTDHTSYCFEAMYSWHGRSQGSWGAKCCTDNTVEGSSHNSKQCRVGFSSPGNTQPSVPSGL
jgi:hypothetical protein